MQAEQSSWSKQNEAERCMKDKIPNGPAVAVAFLRLAGAYSFFFFIFLRNF
jgi:hypothetical protein